MAEKLLYRHERPLFIISIIISIFVWLAVAVVVSAYVISTSGFILVFIFLGFLFYLFIQSAFISFIKGTAVKVTEEQLPDLYKQYLACCNELGMKRNPDIYMIHGGGIFNAFATRFLGRNFVILLSDIVDALEDEKGCLNFYIGHELGHIHRKHLIWKAILIPSSILPLLGPAYSRARESTCDNYGFTCCENPHDAMKGLAALAAGGKRWKTLAINRYVSQTTDTSSFWMSFHELTGGYPWLVKRMARLEAKEKGKDAVFPKRNFFAWLLACFVPPFSAPFVGGYMVMIIAFIGIIAAIAIPQFSAYQSKIFQKTVEHKEAEKSTFFKPMGLVNDFANVIPPSYKQQIVKITSEIFRKTDTSIAVVTMPDIGGAEINDYANRFFSTWVIGEKGGEKGILILVAIKERKIRIEVGYGVVDILPNNIANEILEKYVIPYLKQDRFGDGLLNATVAVSQIIASNAGVSLSDGISSMKE